MRRALAAVMAALVLAAPGAASAAPIAIPLGPGVVPDPPEVSAPAWILNTQKRPQYAILEDADVQTRHRVVGVVTRRLRP